MSSPAHRFIRPHVRLPLLLQLFALLVAVSGRSEAQASESLDLTQAAASLLAPGDCIDDLTTRQNNCTANDVAITEMRVLQVLVPCVSPGDTATVLFRLRLEATADRYDVGLFIGQDGGDARTGDCHHDYLPPPLAFPCCYDATSGVGPFLDAEDDPGSGDECADIEKSVPTFYILQVPVDVLCVDQDSDGLVDVGTCTSWDNNQGTLCQGLADALPGTVAKCRCERINIVNLPVLNLPPTCFAGGPYAGGCREAIVDGATVSDPEGDALTYVWQSSNPAVTVVPGSGTIPAGPGPRPVPRAIATLSPSEPPCNFTATLTLEVQDEAQNFKTCEAIVSFDDRMAPVLSGVPADVTVECDAVPAPASPTAKDDCDPAPKITFVETRPAESCPNSYTLKRTWTATDHCGNAASASQFITVRDSKAPVLSGVPADVTVECDAVPAPASPTAKDNCDPAPKITFVETRPAESCPDSYTLKRTWTATDQCGNAASASQFITVRDSKAPVLSGVPANVTVECDAVPAPASPTAKDNCDPAPKITFSESRTPGSCPGNYVLVRIWTATDRCGNSAIATQTVTVRDTTPPTVEAGTDQLACMWPPNHWYICFTADDFKPVIDDNCSDPVSWKFAGCTSDQPDEAPDPAWPGWNGDGQFTNDCVVAADGKGICVRSERCGTGPTAQDGRHYGVAVVATDACGNTSDPTAIGYLYVPHDQSPQERPCLNPTRVGCRPGEKNRPECPPHK